MKMFVNVARLDIGQLFTLSARCGHLCTLDTFLLLSDFALKLVCKENLLEPFCQFCSCLITEYLITLQKTKGKAA